VPVRAVERIAVIALIIILFNGGIDICWRRFRASAAPILSLGMLGTFATAGALVLIAHYVLGFGWTLAGIVGPRSPPRFQGKPLRFG
jgi:cell volume regulation protein A